MRHRRNLHHCTKWLICALIIAGANRSAWATSFPYGDLTGTNVKFYSVTETPSKNPAPSGFPYPLFGAPLVFGDNLEFLPNDFNANSSGGSFPFTDSQLSMTIVSINPSKSIDSIVIMEQGSYSLIGGGANTQAIVSLNVVLAKILEINGVPIAPIDVPATITYANLGSAASSVVSGELIMNNSIIQPPPLNQLWTATASFDFAAALAAQDLSGPITTVKLALDNTLTALSEVVGPNNNPTTAFIDKKDFSILVDPVPEPTSLALIFLGIAGTVSMQYWRRRNKGDADR